MSCQQMPPLQLRELPAWQKPWISSDDKSKRRAKNMSKKVTNAERRRRTREENLSSKRGNEPKYWQDFKIKILIAQMDFQFDAIISEVLILTTFWVREFNDQLECLMIIYIYIYIEQEKVISQIEVSGHWRSRVWLRWFF